MNDMNIYIHDTEDDGVNYILNNLDERTFAYVILREISIYKINYVIRMNYTTLPNTNEIINYFTLGLDASYQSYFLSGFLSVQSAVDDWVFDSLDKIDLIAHQINNNSSSNSSGGGNSNSSNYTNITLTRDVNRKCQDLTYAQPNNIVFIPFPTYAYDQNPFYTSVGFLLGLAMTSKSFMLFVVINIAIK